MLYFCLMCRSVYKCDQSSQEQSDKKGQKRTAQKGQNGEQVFLKSRDIHLVLFLLGVGPFTKNALFEHRDYHSHCYHTSTDHDINKDHKFRRTLNEVLLTMLTYP